MQSCLETVVIPNGGTVSPLIFYRRSIMEAKQILDSSDETLQKALHKLMYCSNSTRIKNLVVHHNEKDKWSIHVNFITNDQIYDYDGK